MREIIDAGGIIIYENEQWQKIGVLHPGGSILSCQLIERLIVLQGKELKTLEGYKVLDLGCGTGQTTAMLAEAGFKAMGIDYSREMILRGRHLHPDLQLIQAEARYLPFDNSTIDAIFCECVLSEIINDEVSREIVRVLKNGGYLLISDIYLKDDESSYLTQKYWKTMLEELGFSCLYWDDKTEALQLMVSEWIWRYETTDIPILNCNFKKRSIAELGYFQAIYRRG